MIATTVNYSVSDSIIKKNGKINVRSNSWLYKYFKLCLFCDILYHNH